MQRFRQYAQRGFFLTFLITAYAVSSTLGFVVPHHPHALRIAAKASSTALAAISQNELKEQLQEYLDTRKEMNADEIAKQ